MMMTRDYTACYPFPILVADAAGTELAHVSTWDDGDRLFGVIADCGPDVPTTGPTTSEPGGEGGEQPEDHAARIVSRLAPYVDTAWQSAAYAAPIPATPAGAMRAAPDAQGVGSPCDVRGCGRPGLPYAFAGRADRAAVLCDAHRREVTL